MKPRIYLVSALVAIVFAGCDDGNAEEGVAVDAVGPVTADETTDRVLSAAVDVPAATGCSVVGGITWPFLIDHLHDPALTQSAGPVLLVDLDSDNPVPGPRFARGTLLFTAVGGLEDGTVLANHHFNFDAGVVRTQEDHVALTPTDDPCVMSVDSQLFIADGTGAFEGVSGDGRSVGRLDFCTGRGELVWVASYCF